ncbi:TPA: GPO family capsid scaffolding protein [Yersinia enterocolitica]|uniref:GPO family capsid scaffolding protein n=1 Tax=Yersinia kristensenii TaxID=28152 RepID=UPI001C60DE62|nr:GPO family capsid scaffolding protein [Yersinia kristensenii]EKN3970343.1 GPO family capsid scaffolding protein [Yersinia enterocolitica]EKN5144486.1 capsid protein [Yersinia enterocolitica]EKN6086845.1 capsid protein [Yersinia enterocolitica]ELX2300356.1 GPO family capsid scaffolding protein [Yersinia enterocolitica]MBW5826490.1 GPO family capsid scaffolding protein [Yersinia kristensenii]
MPQLKTDWVVIATSGPTIDGREVKPEWLTDAAETYNRSEYTAMIWPYHSSPEWRAFSANLGEVDELKVEKAGDKIQLMARLIPNRFLTEANKAGQKLFTSIEVGENYLGTGKFFLKGVAVTDTPASISTTRLQFSQGEAILMGNTEALTLSLPHDEQAKQGFFSRLFSQTRHKPEDSNTMNEKQFDQLMSAISQTGDRLTELEKQFNQYKEQSSANGDIPPQAQQPEVTRDDKNSGGNATFTLTAEHGEKLFNMVSSIADKVGKMETAFAELSKEATPLPDNSPGSTKFNLI